jgi:threonine dehydrogenase-like Zn-dependent dehydrogenase
MVAVPPGVTDEQALTVSDIFPTAWFGARLAEVGDGDVVVVLGAGPVGQLAALSARIQGAGRVLIVDGNADRLETARLQNVETVDFNTEDPIEVIKELTGGIGADRIIDAVGIDAQSPEAGPATREVEQDKERFEQERARVAPHTNAHDGTWVPGNAPSQALRWAVEMIAKGGTIGIVGVYPPGFEGFPLGTAMNRNLTVKAGNCNHRRYAPGLLSRIATGAADPTTVLTQQGDLPTVIDAYHAFDRREPGASSPPAGPPSRPRQSPSRTSTMSKAGRTWPHVATAGGTSGFPSRSRATAASPTCWRKPLTPTADSTR